MFKKTKTKIQTCFTLLMNTDYSCLADPLTNVAGVSNTSGESAQNVSCWEGKQTDVNFVK